MRLAAIDIGSNSIHMIVVDAVPGRDLRIVAREKDMARLGDSAFAEGHLSASAQARALSSIARFLELARRLEVEAVLASATSAVREAANGKAFLALVRKQTGLSVSLLSGQEEARASVEAGRTLFGIVVLLVLSLGALITPALTSTSINGDRAAGVLATMQTTLLTPLQLVVGKLVAAWAVSLALLGCALPFLLWTFFEGGTPFGRLLVVLAVLALTLLVLCAIGLGWSSLTARTSTSTLLTYLTTAFLGVGLPLLFAVSVPLVQTYEERTEYTVQGEPDPAVEGGARWVCRPSTYTSAVTRTERSWWLLAPSPYVVLADAAPRPAQLTSAPEDPLSLIRYGVRSARIGSRLEFRSTCQPGQVPTPPSDDQWSGYQAKRLAETEKLGITWPFGLAADVLLGLAFGAIAVRRLRAPVTRLPRGTRVA